MMWVTLRLKKLFSFEECFWAVNLLQIFINIVLVAGQSNNGACEKHLAEIEKRPGVYLPSCETDGSYKLKQCDGSIAACWCVNPLTGEEIAGSKVRFLDPNCTMDIIGPCLDDRAKVPLNEVGGYVPNCRDNGLYREKQCQGAECWCVIPQTGKEIIGTRVKFTDPTCPDENLSPTAEHSNMGVSKAVTVYYMNKKSTILLSLWIVSYYYQ